MHELLHVAVLVSTILGGAGLALLALWPLVFESPTPPRTRWVAVALVAAAGLLLLMEWQLVH